jgi:hypothetical protein
VALVVLPPTITRSPRLCATVLLDRRMLTSTTQTIENLASYTSSWNKMRAVRQSEQRWACSVLHSWSSCSRVQAGEAGQPTVADLILHVQPTLADLSLHDCIRINE